MKNLYQAVLEKIESDLPEILWADLNKNQMNYERPPILFPAALVSITLPRCENLNTKIQDVEAIVSIKLCYDFTGNTSINTPKIERDKSLAYLDLQEAIYKTLQGWGTAEFNPLSRINVSDDTPRPDGYKTIDISFETSYRDTTATTV